VADLNEIIERLKRLQETTKERQTKAELGRIVKLLEGSERAPTTSALDVANAFRDVVDQVQTEARESPGMSTTIKSLDLEVKAFVHVEDDGVTALSFPQPEAEVDANSLSTLRISFGAIPAAAPPPEQPS
jgi:hypothetical protein